MRTFCFISAIGLFVSCSSTNADQAEKLPDHNELDVVKESDLVILAREGLAPAVKDLHREKLHPGIVIVPEPFDAFYALHQLFPGNASTESSFSGDDTFQVVWWICEECETISYQYAFWTEYDEEERSVFPDSSWNTTVLLGEEHFLLDGTEYVALLFYHMTMIVPEFSGRFSGGPTGMALFKNGGKDYVLENFIALAGEYGTYSFPVYPEFLVAGKRNILLDFTFANGGAGSDYVSVKELFAPSGETFTRVLREEFLSCSNTHRGEWDSELSILDSNSATGYSDVRIVTSGEFDGTGFEVDSDDYRWVFETAPIEFLEVANLAIRDQSAFSFVLTRTYIFENGRYRPKEIEMKSKKVKSSRLLEKFQSSIAAEHQRTGTV